MSNKDYNDIDTDWAELEETIKETTKNLKRLKDLSKWRFQLGSPDWYEEFEKEMAEAQKGWMSSMC